MKKNERQIFDEETLDGRLIKSSSSSNENEKQLSETTRTRASLMQQQKKDPNANRKAKDAVKTFKRLFLYTWKNKRLLLIANITLVLSSLGMVFLPYLCGEMVDTIRQAGDLTENSLKFIVLTIVMAISSGIRGYSFNLLGEKVMVEMRCELFSTLLEKDITYYDSNKSGQLLSRLGNDISTVYSVCSDNLSMLIRNFLQFIGSLIFLWLVSWKLTSFIIVLTPFITLAVFIVIKKIKKAQKEYSNQIAKTTSLATEVFGNIRVVRSFSNQNFEAKNYETLLKKVYETGKRKHAYYGIMLLIATAFANVLVLSILYFGGKLVIDEQLSIGDLTSFVLYTITLTVGFAGISGIMNQTISAIGICEHIFEIMDEPINVVPGTVRANLDYQSGPIIQFKNACFSYPSKTNVQVLKNISFSIRFGESVAIVGPSGSGKSSIVSLILRFYDLTEGQILINGRNIKSLDMKNLRQHIGFVSQQPTLFSGSLKENIQYGLKQQGDNDAIIQSSLEVSNARQFVYNEQLFPDKLQTIVGERGVKLSGGQKQRIAIARCLAKEPKIMIFDEATSALDAQSEYQVQKAIDALVGKRDRTMIIVAHRLSTIMNCDRIIVVKNGEIVEEGSHNNLLQKKGVYSHLVERQLASKS